MSTIERKIYINTRFFYISAIWRTTFQKFCAKFSCISKIKNRSLGDFYESLFSDLEIIWTRKCLTLFCHFFCGKVVLHINCNVSYLYKKKRNHRAFVFDRVMNCTMGAELSERTKAREYNVCRCFMLMNHLWKQLVIIRLALSSVFGR